MKQLNDYKKEILILNTSIKETALKLKELKAAKQRIIAEAKQTLNTATIRTKIRNGGKYIIDVSINNNTLSVCRHDIRFAADIKIVNNGYWYDELKQRISEVLPHRSGEARAILCKCQKYVVAKYGIKFPRHKNDYNTMPALIFDCTHIRTHNI